MLTKFTDTARSAVPASPDNSVTFAYCRAIYVGTGGNLSVVTEAGETVTLTNIADGTIIPLAVVSIRATGTTASGIVLFR